MNPKKTSTTTIPITHVTTLFIATLILRASSYEAACCFADVTVSFEDVAVCSEVHDYAKQDEREYYCEYGYE